MVHWENCETAQRGGNADERMLKLNPGFMERAGKSLAKMNISTEELARAAWPAAVGKRLAFRTKATSFVRGSLIVEVEDSVWQKQLFYLRIPILEKLSSIVGANVIQDVEFRVAPPRRPPQVAQRHNELKPAADEADSIEDPGMRIVYKQSRRKASA